jgi:nicotinamidase-related amidase
MSDKKHPRLLDAPNLRPVTTRVDPLVDMYRESVVEVDARFQPEVFKNSALLCIDMQYLDAAPGHGVFADAMASGVPPEAQKYYFDRLDSLVFPNVRRIQGCFRMYNLEVIHVRICALTKDGRDRSAGHKRLDLLASPGSKEAEFIEKVAPVGDEIIINKTASGVFTSTNLPYVLSNLGVRSLYVVGVYSDECVSTAIRDGCDLGYFMTLVEDACATVTKERQDATISNLRDRYARVVNTQQVIEELDDALSTYR